jgi:methylglyoxal synthase
MIRLVKAHERELAGLNLVATRGTGQFIRSRVGLSVTLMGSVPLGGDLQIGALVANDELRAVIFLRDPLMAQPHEPDITALWGAFFGLNRPASRSKSATLTD